MTSLCIGGNATDGLGGVAKPDRTGNLPSRRVSIGRACVLASICYPAIILNPSIERRQTNPRRSFEFCSRVFVDLPQPVETPNDFSPQPVPPSEQAPWYHRNPVAANRTRHGSLVERVTLWFFPWTVRGYPGFRKGVFSVLGRKVSWGSVQNWRAGRRPLPLDIAASLVEHIKARTASGQALAAELENYIATEQAKLVRRGPLSNVTFDAAGNPRTNQSKGGRVY